MRPIHRILQICLFMALVLFLLPIAVAQNVDVTINGDQGTHIINKHIYGHFAEHLGRCIYDGIYVGENSGISNMNGVRKDIIDALKALKIPNLRWPGGCFADAYHWKEGVGDKSKRPKLVNRWWGDVVEDNSFGTHDFLNLCEEIGAEPYLAGNVGSGSVQELADWVDYCNKDGDGPMASWRKENGREKPWNVKYWGVGNESWGCGGNMTPEYYANVYKQFATYMTNWGNTKGVFRVASGSSGEDLHWTEVIMRDVPRSMMEGLSLHWYSVINWSKKGHASNFDESLYFATMRAALRMDELITRHSTIMDRYDPEKRVALIVDEWGGWYDTEPNASALYQQNTMRDAMIAGVTLNIFNHHSDRVRMANLAQTVNVLQAVILTQGEKMILTPTYHVMKMYNVHQNATYLPISFQNIDYILDDKKLPAISVSASKNAEGITHVSLVNIDAAKGHTINVNLRGVSFKNVTGTVLSSSRIQDHNTFDQPGKVAPKEFKGIKSSKGVIAIEMPPASVVVLELK